MASTPEQREKWKEQHRLRKLAKAKPNGDVTSYRDSAGSRWNIEIDVDWQSLPMEHAQTAYAELRKEFEKAGRILNERAMPTPGNYTCFICKKTHAGDPRGTDYSYINPETGLMEPILICGELCWLRYQEFRIGKRREAQMPRSA